MNLISLILNILWIITGGIWMAVAWLFAAVIMAITIIGLPWARSALNIASYTLMPFGRSAVSRDEWDGREDLGTSPLGFLGNLIWFVLAGWWLALGHVLTAVALALTIVGIPFAWAHLKLAIISLWPIGKRIVSNEEVEERARADYRVPGTL
ncbi:membrane protein [Skermanella stibiiresistens SB22]|uniref:Inner membrane protein YccF n=1 Tax=Skermanella stibiiresistens SB22 TaxID=1385369 RepID=W9H802_9PROT|nr:YccF domain-containing protein [Skermanella stibiiresistens]EWY39933.1 membrane protein [Skermanella stibiiresistens SB22]